MKINRPLCERKGGCTKPATTMLSWNLSVGRLWRLSCDEHATDRFGSKQPCWVSELIGWDQPQTEKRPAQDSVEHRALYEVALPPLHVLKGLVVQVSSHRLGCKTKERRGRTSDLRLKGDTHYEH